MYSLPEIERHRKLFKNHRNILDIEGSMIAGENGEMGKAPKRQRREQMENILEIWLLSVNNEKYPENSRSLASQWPWFTAHLPLYV